MAETPFFPERGSAVAAADPEEVGAGRERSLCQVRPGDEGLVELLVLGALRQDWPLAFAGGLARAGVSLLDGYARHTGDAQWLGRLVVDPGAGPLPDFAALLRAVPAPLATPTPRLLDFSLEWSTALGGVLHLEVHAWDGLGLLAGVLDCAARQGLRPEELLLETEGECAFHHLILVDARVGPPSRGQRAGLAGALEGLCNG
jgi:hypothetical protein